MPLVEGSSYCTASLGFLHLAKREAFMLEPVDVWSLKDFQFRKVGESWPLLCAVDTSTQTLSNAFKIA